VQHGRLVGHAAAGVEHLRLARSARRPGAHAAPVPAAAPGRA